MLDWVPLNVVVAVGTEGQLPWVITRPPVHTANEVTALQTLRLVGVVLPATLAPPLGTLRIASLRCLSAILRFTRPPNPIRHPNIFMAEADSLGMGHLVASSFVCALPCSRDAPSCSSTCASTSRAVPVSAKVWVGRLAEVATALAKNGIHLITIAPRNRRTYQALKLWEHYSSMSPPSVLNVPLGRSY